MTSRINSKVAVTIAALFSSALAVGATNPLEPNYYAEKFGRNLPPIQSEMTTPYRDNNNPLHPSYGKIGVDQWAVTRSTSEPNYSQANNPLHPSYRR
jgi:hypothetical protein